MIDSFLDAIAIGLGLAGLASFIWALKNGRYDDPDGRTADPAKIGAVAFVEDGSNAVTPDPAPPVWHDERNAALFDMDTEPLSRGEVLKKWSHSRAEIARTTKP